MNAGNLFTAKCVIVGDGAVGKVNNNNNNNNKKNSNNVLLF